MKTKILYIVSHPIQYQAPLLRLISCDPEMELFIIFESEEKGYSYDSGFKRKIKWDVPLTDGLEFCKAIETKIVAYQLSVSDIVWFHGWDSKFKRKMLKLAKSLSIPVLMRGENTLDAMPDGRWLRGVLKRFYLTNIFRNCDGFLCIGQKNKQYYRDHGIPESKLYSMPYAVDNKFFQSRSDKARLNRTHFRRDLDLGFDNPVILFAGKLQRRKQPDLLFDAFQDLNHEELGDPYLLYVGDGEMKWELQKKHETEGGKVRFLGFQNQTKLPSFYDLADIFVLPSEREPWGLAVNEVMNCKTAVVVSDKCGCAADLVDSSCGCIFSAGDKKGLSQALTDLLKKTHTTKKMGEKARDKINNWGLMESLSGLKHACQNLRPSST